MYQKQTMQTDIPTPTGHCLVLTLFEMCSILTYANGERLSMTSLTSNVHTGTSWQCCFSVLVRIQTYVLVHEKWQKKKAASNTCPVHTRLFPSLRTMFTMQQHLIYHSISRPRTHPAQEIEWLNIHLSNIATHTHTHTTTAVAAAHLLRHVTRGLFYKA